MSNKLKIAYLEGQIARLLGKDQWSCPYSGSRTDQYSENDLTDAWESGFNSADETLNV